MKMDERLETTNWTKEKINKFLANGEFFLALMLASNVVNLRLRTLLTIRLQPEEKDWKKITNLVNSLYGFNTMVNLCEKLELLHVNPKVLKDLWSERCSIAHESDIWKKDVTKEKSENITKVCNSAIEFLEKTIG